MRAVIAIVIAVQAFALSRPAEAQSLDGAYGGTITCETISPKYPRPLRSSFKMTIRGGQATFEREIYSPTGQPTGFFERGTGSVNASGAITLTGRAQVNDGSASTSYAGTIASGVARLSGTQNWTKTGARKCTIEAKIGR